MLAWEKKAVSVAFELEREAPGIGPPRRKKKNMKVAPTSPADHSSVSVKEKPPCPRQRGGGEQGRGRQRGKKERSSA